MSGALFLFIPSLKAQNALENKAFIGNKGHIRVRGFRPQRWHTSN
ncbi:hypothetical protein CLOSCI_03529 [[Clostridium] scindens ATCC 35704]|nr:hypothetical protein CLOSCI_03529 [[Clostridium] scindens ATCC 35704]